MLMINQQRVASASLIYFTLWPKLLLHDGWQIFGQHYHHRVIKLDVAAILQLLGPPLVLLQTYSTVFRSYGVLHADETPVSFRIHITHIHAFIYWYIYVLHYTQHCLFYIIKISNFYVFLNLSNYCIVTK